MIKVSKETEYALICLVKLAGDGKKYSARELSDHFTIPYDLCAKILQKLAATGILSSFHGPQGGYVLNIPSEHITFAQISNVMEHSIEMGPCFNNSKCKQEATCNIKSSLHHVHHVLSDYFSRLTLDDFIKNKPMVIGGR